MSNDEFPDLDNDNIVNDLIAHIKMCAHEIKQYSNAKEQSEHKLKEIFKHEKNGSSTYKTNNHKITITTGLNYKLNIKKYLSLLDAPEKIDPKFELVKQVTTYELNKTAIKDLDYFGSNQDKYLKSLFIEESPKKLHIKLEDIKSVDQSIDSHVGYVDGDGVFTPTPANNNLSGV
jgi:hypothetical protein